MNDPDAEAKFLDIKPVGDEPSPWISDPDGGDGNLVNTDGLGRDSLAQHIATVIDTLPSPFTAAVYGGWGEGKTHLMLDVQHRIRELRDADGQVKFSTVWFDLWAHQHDVNPVIAMLQAARQQLYDGATPTGKVVSPTWDAVVTLLWTALDTWPGDGLVTGFRQRRQERREDRMAVQDAQVRLRDLFHSAITDLAGDRRLVFFVDDLDRCLPEQMVDLLEKIRLFMNHDRCVFVVGADPVAVERAIQQDKKYDDPQIAGQYLEKMVQFSFDLPPVESGQRRTFVMTTLREVLCWSADPSWVEPVVDLWQAVFDDPQVDASVRLIKRTVNTFAVDHVIGSAELGQCYDPVVMATLSVLKSCYREPFYRLSHRHDDRRQKLWKLLFRQDDAAEAADRRLGSLFCREGDRWPGGREPDDENRLGWPFVQAARALPDRKVSSVLAMSDTVLGERVEAHFRLALTVTDGLGTPGRADLREPVEPLSGAQPDAEQDRTHEPDADRPGPVQVERLGRLDGLVNYQRRPPVRDDAVMAAACADAAGRAVGETVDVGGITWKVIDKPDQSRVLLLADRVIGVGPYNKAQVQVTWERCDLRAWLNGPFLDSLGQPFQARAVPTKIRNGPNPTWDTEGGNDTTDRVWLLSMQEAARYLAGKGKVDWREYREDSEFGAAGLIAVDDEGDLAWWWLRSPGGTPGLAARVYYDGRVYDTGYSVSASSGGVRPALWLNVESTAP